MKDKAYISSELFKFLRELKQNNNRAWFLANRGRYELVVRDPLLDFIADFGEPLSEISRCYLAWPTAQGGSLFRIYRDTRFGRDKRPYKENAGVHFRHEAGKDVHAPGFYLHLEPRGCFMAGGIWQPDNAALGKIREAIAADAAGWKKIVGGRKFREVFGELAGESLKRPPKGFDPGHPLVEDLKRKDYIAVAKLSQKEVCAAGFMEVYAEYCKAAGPLMRFLTEALGLGW